MKMIIILYMDRGAQKTLADVDEGARVRLGAPTDLSAEVVRLIELGFTRGQPVEVIRRAPFGGPLEVRVRGSRVCLRQSDARRFVIDRAA